MFGECRFTGRQTMLNQRRCPSYVGENPIGANPVGTGLCLAVIALVSCTAGNPASAQIELRLENQDRVHADRIGAASSESHLVIENVRKDITISRRLPWQHVRSVRIDQTTYRVEDVRKVVCRHLTVAAGTLVRNVSHREFDGKARRDTVAADTSRADCVVERATTTGTSAVVLHAALPLEATVISVRDDPLSAYADSVERAFPNGVPLSEAAFVLHLMRARQAAAVFSDNRPAAPAKSQPANRPAQRRLMPPGNSGTQKVQAVSIDAKPVSMHGKLDWDALSVRIRAVGHHGEAMPLRGTLRITLWGQTQRLVRAYGRTLHRVPGRVTQVASWTRAVDSELSHARRHAQSPQRMPNTVQLTLPLPRPLPEHDLSLYPLAELHVQAIVPGQGVFETTERNIVLRHVSPTRNRLLTHTGTRFFDHEATFDSRRRSGPRFRSTSASPSGGFFTVQP